MCKHRHDCRARFASPFPQLQARHWSLMLDFPYIGSPEWITWVDRNVDTRYANGIRPEPGSQVVLLQTEQAIAHRAFGAEP